ncbi:MAG: Tn3 family transposase [Jatrophihabitantaceae bacterium]
MAPRSGTTGSSVCCTGCRRACGLATSGYRGPAATPARPRCSSPSRPGPRSATTLLIAKLHASSRQNSLARALQEYGRLVRTSYLCRYVADEKLRRRVRHQLNKGESLHALRRDLFFAHQGHVRRRHLDDQVDQALCLTLVTNARCWGPRPTPVTPSPP